MLTFCRNLHLSCYVKEIVESLLGILATIKCHLLQCLPTPCCYYVLETTSTMCIYNNVIFYDAHFYMLPHLSLGYKPRSALFLQRTQQSFPDLDVDRKFGNGEVFDYVTALYADGERLQMPKVQLTKLR